ncbi:MAG: MerR family transcriptional regulator [Treponema sp.]|nr:MerR family transcriptional regulator [Treponema sp.]
MYTRGQFAIIGKVGRKALRLYDEEGLLVPVAVNGENGYHYYDKSQLATLEKIKKLRKIGLSLFEIKQILEGKADEKELVGIKIKEMDLHLKEVKEFISSDKKEKSELNFLEPDIQSIEPCHCLFIAENVELENLGMSVGKLYEKAAREGLNVRGSHFVIYENLSDEEDFSMKTCLPVSDCKIDETIEVKEKDCVHINFKDGFSKVGNAHVLIKDYAENHNLKLADKAYEVYNKDMTVDVYYPIR